ncbi:hypothetical protein JIN84_06675 [Luteolibacter yonseiensis]|uniref:Uncharacterized protein n=1 Tax=Luteolibacter yonseiensis TaxID=1144680 RepID=A0A934VBC9_9BACT|nr:hypothetical protein [Luteolibacter yonseiensis]MBK1815289.1 hypothetical protein [Luteolibacter yonseiensis]
MPTFQHPASLNAFQQYRQACAIQRTTSRAGNPAWYQEALSLNLQLHIRADGFSISTWYYDRRKLQWSAGPALSHEILHDIAKLESFIAEALRHARAGGANGLGVILHIADEFSTTELKPELDNPASLPELRATAVTDPGAILEDSSIQADQASWRVLPYPAAGGQAIATTIAVSRQYAPFIELLREVGEKTNFPVVTHALSAPLVVIMGLGDVLAITPGKPFVAILQYPWFTALAFFNEHADLRLVRTLQHRGLRRPTNFRNALATTNASLEFIDPDLFILPLGANVDTTLAADLEASFTGCRVEEILRDGPEAVPAWSPEPLIAAKAGHAEAPAIASHTFQILRDDKWALQNFLPTPDSVLEIYPNRSEMRLLRMLRFARAAIIIVSILCAAYFAFGALDLVRRPEWAFEPSQADAAQGRLARLSEERKKAEHWNNLLEDRSKAWTSMESLSRMFPEKGGMLVKTYSHITKADGSPGLAKVGFTKEWRLTGFARDEALDYLNTINTREGISAHFSEIARITGSSAYLPNTGNRTLVVNVRNQENGAFKPVPPEEADDSDTTTYPFSFDLTITQRFEATDPMAINVAKAP